MNFPVSPIHRRSSLLLAGLALLACAEPGRPPYVRLEGRAPAAVGTGPALVVFWATWCPPCLEELPSLRALARSPPEGLAVVTFGEDDDEGTVLAHFKGPPPPELGYRHDAGRAFAEAFGVDALPVAFLVGDGRLIARFDGPRDWSSRGTRRLLGRLMVERKPVLSQ